ncbi:hypothetical protein E3N88_31929 [Mikania micrantha]|uniref:Uncharacterized protein n=1 Tax=Mikania micrantha TaxID=192012 RepID=A0A5N6M724_9ASTR|nr:hypothetical protein E3N88_31929 [Mikania micrantha]
MDSTLDLNTFDSLIASYNEELFVASEIEVHPINDDRIIFVDEEHGYVPNLPLLREDCYEIPSNGGRFPGYILHEVLRHVFWVDEISRKNYEVFGDVLAFDATYYTNK